MSPYHRFMRLKAEGRKFKKTHRSLGKRFYLNLAEENNPEYSIYTRYKTWVRAVPPATTGNTAYVFQHVATVYPDRIELVKTQYNGDLRRLCNLLDAPVPFADDKLNLLWLGPERGARNTGHTCTLWSTGKITFQQKKLQVVPETAKQLNQHIKTVRNLIKVRANLGVYNRLESVRSWQLGEDEFVKLLTSASQENSDALEELARPVDNSWDRSKQLTPADSFEYKLKRFRRQARITSGAAVVVDANG